VATDTGLDEERLRGPNKGVGRVCR
jgi:hypothetical protein